MITDHEKHSEIFLLPSKYNSVLVVDGEAEPSLHFAVQFVNLELSVVSAVLEERDFFTCFCLQIKR